MTLEQNYRNDPAFAGHDDNLFDLSTEELTLTFQDLTRRASLALAESIQHTSDSNIDDVNILTIIIPTAANIVYGHDQTMETIDALLLALDNGLIQDLHDLRIPGNSYDNALINDALIWKHCNITDD